VTEALASVSIISCLDDNCLSAGKSAREHNDDFTTFEADILERRNQR
jgi:hypothetical protein